MISARLNCYSVLTSRLVACCLAIGALGGCSTSNAKNEIVTEPEAETALVQETPECCKSKAASETATAAVDQKPLEIPDVELIDHNGNRVRLYTDLVKGRNVAINTFFTSCTTICPVLTATVANVQKKLLELGRDDIQLISISVDPTTDTPSRLKAWSENFNVQPGWTLLTGDKASIDQALKALQSFTPDPKDHSPMILIGNEPSGTWKQVFGLAPPATLCDAILEMAGPKKAETRVKTAPSTADSTKAETPVKTAAAIAESTPPTTEFVNAGAKKYFTDVELVDQFGRPQRLYTDLLRGRVVVIDAFFSSCTGVCPVLNERMTAIKKAFPDELGDTLLLLSMSVDPAVDTPPRLKEYAKGLRAGPNWLFLTGERDNLKTALTKLGMYTDTRENHSNLLLIGNDKTGLWKKAFGLAPDEEIVEIVRNVLNDTDSSASAEAAGQSATGSK